MTNSELILKGVEDKAYPRMLYKYRIENPNTQKIITHNQLWFSNPSLFNDPYDCNTPILASTSLTDFQDWFKSVGLGAVMSLDEAHKRATDLKEAIKKNVKDAIDKFYICCFSTLDNSILQWSHYANYHKGICFGFDLTCDPDFFAFPVIVAYRQVMQHYNHFWGSDKIIEYIIKPKFHDWSYESEVRVVKGPENSVINPNGKGHTFNDTALTEVIFGASTPQVIIDQYKNLCANHNKSHVTFYKMQLGGGTHYELERKLC